MTTDVLIIGGGAAGLASAVYLKKNAPSLSVRVLEALPRVGKKLAVTGNGRCNITNKNIELSRYHGKDTSFCDYALKKYDLSFTENFFKKIGVDFAFEGEKAYPSSFQAGSVVDCLRFAAENLGVITHTEFKVDRIKIKDGKYLVFAGEVSLSAKNVIIAAGLYSGGEKTGSDGSMLTLLKSAGYKATEVYPAIVQLKTDNSLTKQLKGIKSDALVTLFKNGKALKNEFGEILFTDYGLSGPPVLQLSGYCNDGVCEVSLDLVPDVSPDELYGRLSQRAKDLSYLALDEFLTGMLNKRVGQIIVKTVGLKLNESVSLLREKDIRLISSKIKDLRFKVTGNTGFSNSQVTAGGLITSQFDATTMMSKTDANLYAVGEILDIYGDCGGFNLQWAWSSAFCASDAIIDGAKK